MDSHAISILSCVCYNVDEKKSNANMILVMQSVGGRMTVFFLIKNFYTQKLKRIEKA